MKLKFENKDDVFPIIIITEVVGPLSTGFPETLGFIFEDELGCHWKISDDYSNVIELEELEQIVNKMREVKNEKTNT